MWYGGFQKKKQKSTITRPIRKLSVNQVLVVAHRRHEPVQIWMLHEKLRNVSTDKDRLVPPVTI
jgi:hypothetical protein